MTRFALFFGALIPFVFLSGCQFLYPDSEPEVRTAEDLSFDGSYYGQNAKEYFQGGHYAKAKDQWVRQLAKEPDNWMAKLGVASCDYYMGSLSIDLGDIRGGRDNLQSAEAAVRELWDGTIEADTFEVRSEPVRQWQAAFILSITHRALGDCDHMEALMATQRLATIDLRDRRRDKLAKHRMKLEKQSESNYSASLALLAKLVKMKHASEEAYLNYAELLARSGDNEQAEKHFLSYLEVARTSLDKHLADRKALLEAPGEASKRAFTAELWDKKIQSNTQKQVGVLVRLGNIHYDDAHSEAERSNGPRMTADQRLRARNISKVHYTKSLDYLRQAQVLQPEKLDLLVKMAQCEGELGFYESAILNVEQFISKSAQDGQAPDESIHRAYRLKADLEKKYKARKERLPGK